MTNTQIAYWELEEKRRHNLATEGLQTQGHHETVRHNRATEAYALKDLGERSRHNQVTEGQGAQQLVISRLKLDEDVRHNRASEMETQRSNRAREIETERSNRAREMETNRHNLADEILSGARNTIEASKAAESMRHNLVAEQIETQRVDNQLTTWGLVAQTLRGITNDVSGNLASLIAGLHPKTGLTIVKNKVDNFIEEARESREQTERESAEGRQAFRESGLGPTQYTKQYHADQAAALQQRDQEQARLNAQQVVSQQKSNLQRKRAG